MFTFLDLSVFLWRQAVGDVAFSVVCAPLAPQLLLCLEKTMITEAICLKRVTQEEIADEEEEEELVDQQVLLVHGSCLVVLLVLES